jgi:hypothetical protein
MSWNFTLSLILPTVADGWGQWDTAMVGNFRVGSPISLRVYTPLKPANMTSHQGFAHITGVPDTINIQTLRERVTGGWMDDSTPPEVVERVEWIVRSDLFSAGGSVALLNNRIISVPWEALKDVSWSLKLERSAIDADFI